jgi:hypothetical protein
VDFSPQVRELVETFRKHLFLPDFGLLLITLATYVANVVTGDPLWVMLVGASGGGKTEVLNSAAELPHVRAVSTVTPGALLSGTAMKERSRTATGGLLREIGEFGVMVIRDFTSMLSMNRNQLKAVLAALREIYDGYYTRDLGTDGGLSLAWKGKIGVIGGVTTAFYEHHQMISSMGNRFLLYHLPELTLADQEEIARIASEMNGREAAVRATLISAVQEFMGSVDFSTEIQLTDAEQKAVIALGTLTARCRSAVSRDGYSREITLIHDPETPTRVCAQLTRLASALQRLGVHEEERLRLTRRVALDCIDPVRREVLDRLAASTTPMDVQELASGFRYSETTMRRTLQEFAAHSVVQVQKDDNPGKGGKESWSLREEWRERYWTGFPKCTDG